MFVWALLGLALTAPLRAEGEGSSHVVEQKEHKEDRKEKPVTPETYPAVEGHLASLPDHSLRGRFWGESRGWERHDQRHAADLLDAFYKGPDVFRDAIFASGLSPAHLRRLFKQLGPFLLDADPKTGKRERPVHGPAPEVWEGLVKRFPQDPEGHSALGEARLDRKDYSGAVEAFDQAIGLGARNVPNLVGRSVAAERLGDFQQANHDAQEALRLAPLDASAAALFRLTQGRPSRVTLRLTDSPPRGGRVAGGQSPSLDAAGSAQTPAQSSAYWTREAARALELGDLRAALSAATRAMENDAGNVEAMNLRAMARERSGDRRAAVLDATRGLDAAPGNVALLNTRSWALSGLKDYDDALRDASRAVGLSPENAFSRATMARAEGGLGRRDEMLGSLKEAARLDPRFAAALEGALRLPRDQDTELLFQGGLGGLLSPRPPRRLPRFLFLFASTLFGGILVAVGILQLSTPGWRERVTTALTSRLRRAPQPEPPPGRFWNHYTFKRVVASGGMGIVYEAVDRGLGRRVAVKQMRGEIRDDPKEREAFLREARVVASVKHPAIVEIYSIIEEGPDLYLVFEFVEGGTLQAFIQERGRLAVSEALALFKDVCAAVQHAHDKGVIHRDLKPSNIMVTPDGRAKVMDFGLARRSPESRSVMLTATAAGTPSYMAPEAESGVLQKESDVFSLGVCFYEMLTGRLPYEGMAGGLSLRKESGKFEPASRRAPAIPEGIDAALALALAPQPAARQDSPGVLYAQLARAA